MKMIQGVREVFEIVDIESKGEEPKAGNGNDEAVMKGKLVLIGRGLHAETYEMSLKWHLDLSGEET